MVSIDQLIESSSAIVDAFNPAQKGPLALAALLMGNENRCEQQSDDFSLYLLVLCFSLSLSLSCMYVNSSTCQ